MKLILATSNKDKVREIKKILDDKINIFSPGDLNIDSFEVVEDGKTLKENAYKKAKAIYDITNLPTLADDTGLFVKSLDFRPGVYSHRYANENPTYKENRDKLLSELKDKDNRQAYFMTVLCFIDSRGKDYYFEGRINGEISHREHGDKDFGYDQIFRVNSKTFGEMKEEEKNSYSHRAKALDKFKNFIKNNYESISS
ncbi:RdgB/HAM1 family non-canonical purine NTP pyrophosphatase [Anaerococcus sp. AGMB00486]|uniref:dITP/XTP pyrophosphatase n=2 Tax=Anaerococcus TaxID=165779 RepID=A0ABX2N7I8_9FIRM|nr:MULTISPECIES: RdgB/HAM1 family non-canonical purine NTP pyrophosphatase [Anaerococcus]MSS76865.1 RdgB/HAM1 family non-canonical purine NTP pyrophosphatase [Anaerococcus porci]NVF10651.1 RdgB/HAM1 family non-canonical purine NTP pyrophosphatase [Anaerococcus faecalis]